MLSASLPPPDASACVTVINRDKMTALTTFMVISFPSADFRANLRLWLGMCVLLSVMHRPCPNLSKCSK